MMSDKKKQQQEPTWEEFCEFIENTDVFEKAAQESFALGLPVWGSDENDIENRLVKKYPNGKKELYKTWWKDHEFYEEKIKDLN